MGGSVTSRWVEYRTPQGRPYWYHSVEKRSVWDKPAELKTARERAIDATPWRVYKAGERSYYVHRETKTSTWTMPPEIKHIYDTVPDDPPEAVPMNAPASPHAAARARRRAAPAVAAGV
ncbi:PRP40 [Malassezia furfur]|nr:PRP40 [Malassezia furfur]